MKTNHPIVKIIDFEIVRAYTLRVSFDDGTKRVIDFAPVLRGYYYAPLTELSLFSQVRLDPEVHTLVWPNGADFDPATLYNWDRGDGNELAQRGARWQQQFTGF